MSEDRQFKKGDWTTCIYEICEILKDGEIYCTVATRDADLIIDVLNEIDALKKQRDELFIRERNIKNEWGKLKKENEYLKEKCDWLEGLLIDNGLM